VTGLLCPVCGLDALPATRTAACSARCRRRAAVLRRRERERLATAREQQRQQRREAA